MLTISVELRCTSVTFAPLECRSCAMSWPLLPVPIHQRFLARHSSPSVYRLECITCRQSLSGRNIGQARNAADAGGEHDVAGMHDAPAAVGAAQHHGPARFLLIVVAALKFVRSRNSAPCFRHRLEQLASLSLGI